MVNTVLFNLVVALYALGTFHYLIYLFYQREIVSKVAFGLTLAGLFLHTLFFVMRLLASGYFPITNLFEAVSFFAWAVVLAFILAVWRYRLKVLGAFIMPIPLVMMISASLSTLDKGVAGLLPALNSKWLYFHTTFAFLGDAAFVVCFACGVMYLLQERQLKKKHPGMFYHRLPSLDILDRINYHALTIGFPLLTLGIITGAVWANYAWGTYWSWDPKETWSLITWFIYAALLHARMTVGWRGRKAAWFAIIGFIAVLITFFGVNLFIGGTHAEYNSPPPGEGVR
jgi:cytochrome c-type biogenesis protein CcsB